MLLLLGLLPLICAFTCPPNTIYHAEFDRCYKFSPDTLPFYMAEEACQSLGGHLVSFQEGLENAMVAETAQQQRIGSPFWIGLNKLNGNAWDYTDDSQVSFTNWQDGNQTSSAAGTCAVSTLPDGVWQSVPCSQSHSYVCAISTIVPVVTCPPCPTVGCPTPPSPPGRCQSGWTYFAKTDSCYKNVEYEPDVVEKLFPCVHSSMQQLTNISVERSSYFLHGTFGDAEGICQANDGHLTSIHSSEENIFVATLTRSGKTVDLFTENTWIGMKQATYPTSTNWTWTDGSPVDYLFWAPGQPNNENGSKLCVMIESDYTPKEDKDATYQRWDAYYCDVYTMRAYVCKKASLH